MSLTVTYFGHEIGFYAGKPISFKVAAIHIIPSPSTESSTDEAHWFHELLFRIFR